MLPPIRVCLCAAVVAGLMLAEGPLRLKTREIKPEDPDLFEYLVGPPKRRHPGKSHYLLQFRETPMPAQIRALRERGAVVTSRVPEAGVMVAGPDDLDLSGLDLHWAGRLRQFDKISPVLQKAAEILETPRIGAYLIELHPDVDIEDGRKLASEHYLTIVKNPNLLPHQLLVEGTYDRVTALAEWDEVAYIFPASRELRFNIPVVGCPGPLLAEGPVGEYVKIGQGWPATGSGDIVLHWILENYPAHLSPGQTQSEVVRALAEWAKYAKLSFTPGSAAAVRTIEILFASGSHGDPYPFDGPGKVLAHTFYPAPPNPETLAGDMHLDADEDWRVGQTVDLFSVVLHELGHALGLGHSDRPGSVMYPYYRSTSGLGSDDIAGIRDLYGERDTAETPPDPETPSTPVTPSDPGTPSNPGTPSVPDGPTNPGTPSEPGTPTTPETPETPSNPGNPSTPETPEADPPIEPPAGPDSVAPSLTITAPGSTVSSTRSDSFTFRGMAGDEAGVVSVKWVNSTGGSGDASGTTFWTCTVPLVIGNNIITIRAFDAAGNSSWRSVTLVRK